MKKQLADKYDHQLLEADKYQKWVEAGYFTAGDTAKKPFTLVIPPPNVTGALHMGHAWDYSLQDVIIRYKRMQGYDALYLAGMDHAGIATQAKVDQKLQQAGTDRFKIGREEFLKEAWLWKQEHAEKIRQQWARLGLSLDYSRERFTPDAGLSAAVTKVFCELYNEGLIYQGYRIINWDPQAKTALSNIEVIHKEIEGTFYTFNYRIVETGEDLYVATTRPETMFGDVCVVVNPDDPRYQALHNCHVINPANGQELPIITDEYVDIDFGTGAMKCTPAHDPHDFEIGRKYGLAMPLCINPDGTMNELAEEFAGLDRFDCRTALVAKLQKQGDLVKQEQLKHQVGHSERTDCVVEPYLSQQWFVKMRPLADEVLKYQQSPEGIKFFPERFDHIFALWLENIEDWCISRQLWWGHRIPAYYHKVTGELIVGEQPADAENYVQDPDVLDTWFSSALWPFSTLGWPEDTADFRRYYPTDVLVTGYDIIFFWVARMAFQARYFTGSAPFAHCLIHGLIRDDQGRKMSKSLGNGIDPMDVIDKYGADALRFFLTTCSAPGLDMRYSPEKVEAAGNFINKIYNAARFVLLNVPADYHLMQPTQVPLGFCDHWIFDRLDKTIVEVTKNLDKYEFALVGSELNHFIWDDFCSSYIELAKTSLKGTSEERQAAVTTLLTVLLDICKLIHPFMPFVSEEIYGQIKDEPLCKAAWPQPWGLAEPQAIKEGEQVLAIIEIIRAIKVEYQLKPAAAVDYNFRDLNQKPQVYDQTINDMVKKLTGAQWQQTPLTGETVEKSCSYGIIALALDDLVDKTQELNKTQQEAEALRAEITRSRGMLENAGFLAKAPAAKIADEKAKLADYQARYEAAMAKLNQLRDN